MSVSSAAATGADDLSIDASVSADGRYVAFASRAADLVPGFVDHNGGGSTDVFLRDRQTGTTVLVSHSNLGPADGGNNPSDDATVSADGRYVVFVSGSTNFAAPGNGLSNVYRYEVATGAITLVSRSAGGAAGISQSYAPAISGDGRYVAFGSIAPNLIAASSDGSGAVYLYDNQTGGMEVVSRRNDGSLAKLSSRPSVSDDGRYVVFSSSLNGNSFGPPVVAADANDVSDVFLRDRTAGTTTLVSRTPAGAAGNALSDHARISGNGAVVVFESDATDLAAGDVNAFTDVFAYDVATGAVTRVSSNPAGFAADDDSTTPTVSGDGNLVAFASRADDLLPSADSFTEVYVWDRTSGELTRPVDPADPAATRPAAVDPFLSAGGTWLVFESQGTNYDPDTADANGSSQDVFLAPRVAAPVPPAQADLVVTTLADPAGAYAPGGAVAVSATVANAGGTATGDFTVRFALSADAVYDPADTELATVRMTGLAAGAQATAATSATVPAGAAAGSYYVVARADAPGEVVEASDTNNDAATPAAGVIVQPAATDLPNLVAGPLAVKLKTASVVGGSKAPSASLRVTNAGTVLAEGAVTITVVASTDGTVDADDAPVATFANVKVKLKPGRAKAYKLKLGQFPSPADGSYLLLAHVDSGGAVAESSEGDNVGAAATPVTIAAPFVDLQPATGAAGPAVASLVPGGNVAARVPLLNAGNIPVKATTEARLYASLDPVLDAGDTALATSPVKVGLKAGQTKAAKLKFRLPDALPPAGSYFLLVGFDATNAVAERDEGNNVVAGAEPAVVD